VKCVFMYNDINHPNRIQIMSVAEAKQLEKEGLGRIIDFWRSFK
jgi:hypothetical protein